MSGKGTQYNSNHSILKLKKQQEVLKIDRTVLSLIISFLSLSASSGIHKQPKTK